MITTLEQAKLVQTKRVAAGKEGHSTAVRAFCKRNLDLNKPEDYEAYLTLKLSLPHIEIGSTKKKVVQTKKESSTNKLASVIAQRLMEANKE